MDGETVKTSLRPLQPARQRRRWPVLLIPGVLCAAFFVNGLNDAIQNSAVADEVGGHTAAGYLYWTSGRYSGGIANFPLGHLLIGLPAALFSRGYELFTEQHLLLFRLPNLVLGLLLGLALYRFTTDLLGRPAGIAALSLYALSPNILAHASLATLDVPMACFAFLTVYALWRYVKRPHWIRMFVLSLALACALATKIQALVLIPVVAGVLIVYALRDERVNVSRTWLLLAAVPWVFINAVYLNMPLRTGWLLPPSFLAALATKLLHAQHAQSHAQDAYLLGQYSSDGWWYYFPLAILFKTPPATLVLLALGLARRPTWPRALFIFLPAATLLGITMAARVNIGIRHVLPVYPFLFMLAGYGAALLWQRSWRGVILLGLGLSYVCEAVVIAPYHLSYFNVLAGGPSQGHRVLVDSNYDWGQNDRVLQRYIAARGVAYQIDPDPYQPTTGHILVNANAFYGVYGNGWSAAYAWLKDYVPVRQIAYTWFEYDVPAKDAELAATQVAEQALAKALPRSLFRPWDEGVDVQQRNAALQEIAGHLRALRDQYAALPDRELQLTLGLAFIGVAAYDDSLDQARRLLAQDPGDEQALGLGGEVMVRWKLGVLNFQGEQYLHGFRAGGTTSGPPPELARTAQAARLTGIQSMLASVHAAAGEALNRAGRYAEAAREFAAARTFDPAVQTSPPPAWQR